VSQGEGGELRAERQGRKALSPLPSALGALRGFRLASRALTQNTGERRSKLSGSGGEFLDYRAYETGDEPRFIDWNVYARSGKLFVRRFATERATRVYAVLDTSRSMQDKLEVAQEIRQFTRLFAGQDQWLEREVLSIGELNRLALERPGLVLLFSDGLEPLQGIRTGLSALTARGFDISWLQVLSKDDLEPPTGAWRIKDAESTGVLEVDDGARGRYLQRLHKHLEALGGLARNLGLRLARFETATPNDVFARLRRAGMLERG
jgi:uncharacterized protein (DUF58 family)